MTDSKPSYEAAYPDADLNQHPPDSSALDFNCEEIAPVKQDSVTHIDTQQIKVTPSQLKLRKNPQRGRKQNVDEQPEQPTDETYSPSKNQSPSRVLLKTPERGRKQEKQQEKLADEIQYSQKHQQPSRIVLINPQRDTEQEQPEQQAYETYSALSNESPSKIILRNPRRDRNVGQQKEQMPDSPSKMQSPSRILLKQEDRYLNANIGKGMFADHEESVDELKVAHSTQSFVSSSKVQLRSSKSRKPLKLTPVRSLAQQDKVKVIGQDQLNRLRQNTERPIPKILLNAQEIAGNPLFARQYIPKHKKLQAVMKRNRQGTNWLFPQYDLFLNEDMLYIMTSKRKPFFATSTYFLSSTTEPVDDPSGPKGLGKLESNLTGSIFSIMDTDQHSNQLLATIEYISQISCSFMPRSIIVYVLSPYYHYKDLSGLNTRSDKLRNLKQLYSEGDNAENKRIIKLQSKQPHWVPEKSIYCLDFHGKALMSSIKNMILVQSNDQNKQVMLLAKAGENSYNFQVNFPLSPRVAMGIANSSFDFKWISQ